MQAIRNAMGSMGIGKDAHAHSKDAHSTGYHYKMELVVKDLFLERIPEAYISRNKFEPYLSFKRNDDNHALHRTWTKKDYNLATRDVVRFNETYVVDANDTDVIRVLLYNDAPLLRPDYFVAEGLIPLRDFLSSGTTSTSTAATSTLPSDNKLGRLINTRDIELPLHEVPEDKRSSGLMGRSRRHSKSTSPDKRTGHTATTGTSSTMASTVAAPTTVGILGRVRLQLRIFDTRQGTQATGATTGTTATRDTTNVQAAPVGDPLLIAAGKAAHVGENVPGSTLATGGVVSTGLPTGVTSKGARSDNLHTQPGLAQQQTGMIGKQTQQQAPIISKPIEKPLDKPIGQSVVTQPVAPLAGSTMKPSTGIVETTQVESTNLPRETEVKRTDLHGGHVQQTAVTSGIQSGLSDTHSSMGTQQNYGSSSYTGATGGMAGLRSGLVGSSMGTQPNYGGTSYASGSGMGGGLGGTDKFAGSGMQGTQYPNLNVQEPKKVDASPKEHKHHNLMERLERHHEKDQTGKQFAAASDVTTH